LDAAGSVDDLQAQIRVDVAARLELTPVVEEAEDTVAALPDDGFDDTDSAIGYAPGTDLLPGAPARPAGDARA
ncbi:MAG: hypothetical protein ACTMID_07695, partial [Cellulosimicrobium funkei]